MEATTNTARRDHLAQRIEYAIEETRVLDRWLHLLRRRQDTVTDEELTAILDELDVPGYVERCLEMLGGSPVIIKWVEEGRQRA